MNSKSASSRQQLLQQDVKFLFQTCGSCIEEYASLPACIVGILSAHAETGSKQASLKVISRTAAIGEAPQNVTDFACCFFAHYFMLDYVWDGKGRLRAVTRWLLWRYFSNGKTEFDFHIG